MIIQKITAYCASIIQREHCIQRLTLSCCAGIYVAFSPFIAIKSIVIFAIARLLKLSAPVMFVTCTIIHNPWTMVPLYMLGYWTGQWLVEGVCAIHSPSWDPIWMQSITAFISQYIGIRISLLPFVVGCNTLGIFFACILYPFARRLFERHKARSLSVSSSIQ